MSLWNLNFIKMKSILPAKTGYLILFLFSLLFTNTKAQDIQYAQFYANVLYLNPAFAGNQHALRGIFHHRLQWPSLDAKYVTTHFSADTYLSNINSGVGFMIYKDVQGYNNISSVETALQYAYELNLTRKHAFRAGFQLSYVSRSIDYASLRFPDQFNEDGYMGSQTNQPTDAGNIGYLDLTTGGIFYSDKYWLGLAYAHMNQPNQSFQNEVSRLPYKLDFTAGYRIDLEKKNVFKMLDQGKNVYLTPTFHYKTQGKSDQMDFGVYFMYDFIITGIWYRGIPFLKKYRSGLQNNESFVALAGVKINQLSVTYSYDVTVSRLSVARTGGSHEINVTYTHKKSRRKKIMKRIPCPNF